MAMSKSALRMPLRPLFRGTASTRFGCWKHNAPGKLHNANREDWPPLHRNLQSLTAVVWSVLAASCTFDALETSSPWCYVRSGQQDGQFALLIRQERWVWQLTQRAWATASALPNLLTQWINGKKQLTYAHICSVPKLLKVVACTVSTTAQYRTCHVGLQAWLTACFEHVGTQPLSCLAMGQIRVRSAVHQHEAMKTGTNLGCWLEAI